MAAEPKTTGKAAAPPEASVPADVGRRLANLRCVRLESGRDRIALRERGAPCETRKESEQ